MSKFVAPTVVAAAAGILSHPDWQDQLDKMDLSNLAPYYIPVKYKGTVLCYLTSDNAKPLSELKLHSGLAKALTHMPSGTSVCLGFTQTQHSSASMSQTNESLKEVLGGYRPKDEMAVVALRMGYLEISETWVEQSIGLVIAEQNRRPIGSRSTKAGQEALAFVKAADKSTITIAVNAIRANPGIMYGKGQSVGTLLRSPKPVNPDDVQKWRKPPGSSPWPYTIDHLWFLARESQLAVLNAQMHSLMGSNADNDKEQFIDDSYPAFKSVNEMKSLRASLEALFGALNDTALTTGWQEGVAEPLCSVRLAISKVGWPIYGPRDPFLTAIKALIAMKMRPKFDANGNFAGFVELEQRMSGPTDPPVYVSYTDIVPPCHVEPSDDSLAANSVQRGMNSLLVQAYDAGLVPRDVLDQWLTDTTANLAVKYGTADYMHISMSDRLVLCVPLNESADTPSMSFVPAGRTNKADIQTAIAARLTNTAVVPSSKSSKRKLKNIRKQPQPPVVVPVATVGTITAMPSAGTVPATQPTNWVALPTGATVQGTVTVYSPSP